MTCCARIGLEEVLGAFHAMHFASEATATGNSGIEKIDASVIPIKSGRVVVPNADDQVKNSPTTP